MPHQAIPGSEGHARIIQTRKKARIGKRAAEFGVTNTVRRFGKQFADRPLKENTVTTRMMNYKKELASRVKTGGSLTIEKLKTKKRGHPYCWEKKWINNYKNT